MILSSKNAYHRFLEHFVKCKLLCLRLVENVDLIEKKGDSISFSLYLLQQVASKNKCIVYLFSD